MTDRRLLPANGRVAAAHLRGQVQADRFVEGTAMQIGRPLVDLRSEPGGARERQLCLGAEVTVYEDRDGWAFVQADADGYVGYVEDGALAERVTPTHWVAVPAGHAYAAPDIKAPETRPLLFGARLATVSHQPGFFETHAGDYIPKRFLWPIDKRFADPVTAAQLFFGAPYLWGGNSVRGIDCSGLVQAGLRAVGRDCPGDSDLQETALGTPLPADADLRRGDLLFWRGHVGWMVDGATLLHANAHHMAVAYEPVQDAIRRIEAQGDGPVTSRRRI